MINRQPRHKRTGADAVRKRGKQTEQRIMNPNPVHPSTHAHTRYSSVQLYNWPIDMLSKNNLLPYWAITIILNTTFQHTEHFFHFLYNIWRVIQMQIKMNNILYAYSLYSLKRLWRTCELNKQIWRTGGYKIGGQNWITILYIPFFKLLLLLQSEFVVFACKRRHTVTEHSQSKF